MNYAIILPRQREFLMSLKQIHVLNQVIRKEHRNVKRELKLLEIKKVVYDKLNTIAENIVETYQEIVNRFFYEETTLAYTKRK